MKIIIGQKEFELRTNLYTVKKIQSAFSDSFMNVISKIEKMSLEEQTKILLCGYDGNNEELENAIYENWSLLDVFDNLETFIENIQYGGLSAKEKEKKEAQMIEKYQKAKETGLVK